MMTRFMISLCRSLEPSTVEALNEEDAKEEEASFCSSRALTKEQPVKRRSLA